MKRSRPEQQQDDDLMAILDSKSHKVAPKLQSARREVALKRSTKHFGAANVVAVNQPQKKRLTKKEKKLQKS